jgi:hypothetical protein
MAKRFKIEDCQIPSVWCGKGNIPRKTKVRYSRTGTRFECMKKGFGAGMNTEKMKYLPEDSLQRIRYIGKKYEDNFGTFGYRTTKDLIRGMKSKSQEEMESELLIICKKSTGAVDWKAYNSTIEYLYLNGVRHTPNCRRIRV